MPFLRRCRFAFVGLVSLALLTSAAVAQSTDYSKPKTSLLNFFSQYTSWKVPQPSFTNTPRVDQLVKDGKLMLSLNDAIALALENNLDLAIARYNLPIADTDILRARAGSSTRGVSTGVVQGTPGGTGVSTAGASGSGAGGTSTGAGGAGTGTGGIVTSTLGGGSQIDSFDPILTSSMNIEHSNSQLSNNVIYGNINTLAQNTGVANFTYSQAFPTGTGFSVSFNNNRNASNVARNLFNPQVSSNYRITMRQHLLQGWGIANNNRNMRLAKNSREITDIAFREQVIATVTQIQNIYWDLVNAYEDMQVKQESLALAQKTLADNRKQVEIGTLAPIEIVRAESEVATREQDLITSQTNLQLQQLYMKNAISRNLTDASLMQAPVVPTDTMELPATEPVVPTDDLINDALSHRPDLAQSQIDLRNRDISKRALRNALLPSLDFVSWYGTSALAGVPVAVEGVPTAATTGYSDAFSDLFSNKYKDYAVALSLTIPIRNRPAQADQVRSELEYRQAQMRLQQVQNTIRIQVRNAQFAVQQNRAAVEAARKAVELQRQNLDAEQKKYALGASTNILVLGAQRDLAQAESNLVSAMSNYEKSKVALDQQTGLTLTHLGIEIADAENGKVQKMPAVPGLIPRQDVNLTQPAPSPTQK